MAEPPAPWQPTKITLTGEPVKTATRPALCVTDAGDAYLKAMWAPGTGEMLIRELIGLRLAAALGLDAPPCVIHPLQPSEVARTSDAEECRAGPALLIRSIPWGIWDGTAKQLRMLTNREDLAGLVVLDTWLRNADRYPPAGPHVPAPGADDGSLANVALSPDPARPRRFRIRAVDFSHCLHPTLSLDPTRLGADAIADDAVYGLFPAFAALLRPRDVDRAVARLDGLSAGLVPGIMAEVPPEWWGLHGPIAPVVADFLTGRLAVVRSTIRGILGSRLGWLKP